jgi:hypothetical protein
MLRFLRASVIIILAAGLAAGCSTLTDDVETPTYDVGLFPKVAHSGFNPKATFKVMFATSAPDPQWSISDPSLATFAPSAAPKIEGTNVSDLKFILVTTTKAGDATITMRSGTTVLTAQLQVKAYTDEHLTVGKARYETASPDPARPPCASCHQKPGGVDHSPLKMAGFDDQTILGVIQEATYPASATGSQSSSTTSAFAPKGPLTKLPSHKWNISDIEKDGILSHLRSLPLGGVQ